jgi:hypothetical protein
LGFLADSSSCGHVFSGSEVPLAYCTRFSAKYKGHKPEKTCGNGGFGGRHAENQNLHSNKKFYKNPNEPEKIEKLVVVMSAVDRWKSSFSLCLERNTSGRSAVEFFAVVWKTCRSGNARVGSAKFLPQTSA